jgi:hypothetical protein
VVDLVVAAKPGSSGSANDSCPLPFVAVPENGGLAGEDGIAGAVRSGSAIVGQDHSGPIQVTFPLRFWLEARPDVTPQETVVNPAPDVSRRHLELLRPERSCADLGSWTDHERHDGERKDDARGFPKQSHFEIITQSNAPRNRHFEAQLRSSIRASSRDYPPMRSRLPVPWSSRPLPPKLQ